MSMKDKEVTKLYWSIGEVAEMFDVSKSLIRFFINLNLCAIFIFYKWNYKCKKNNTINDFFLVPISLKMHFFLNRGSFHIPPVPPSEGGYNPPRPPLVRLIARPLHRYNIILFVWQSWRNNLYFGPIGRNAKWFSSRCNQWLTAIIHVYRRRNIGKYIPRFLSVILSLIGKKYT